MRKDKLKIGDLVQVNPAGYGFHYAREIGICLIVGEWEENKSRRVKVCRLEHLSDQHPFRYYPISDLIKVSE